MIFEGGLEPPVPFLDLRMEYDEEMLESQTKRKTLKHKDTHKKYMHSNFFIQRKTTFVCLFCTEILGIL